MLYTHAIAGSAEAARFLSPNDPSAAPGIVVSIMETKLQSYLRFNETFPGFGGFLPWFESDIVDIKPTWDWYVKALHVGILCAKKKIPGSTACLVWTTGEFFLKMVLL